MQETIRETATIRPYAGVGVRLAAYAIDCCVLFLALLLWQAALFAVNPILALIREGQQPGSVQLHGWVFATATLPFLLYFAFTQSSAHQATFGMRWLNIHVATLQGTRLSFVRALTRSAVMLLPFEINHAVLFHLLPRDGSAPAPAFGIGVSGVWILIAIYVAAAFLTHSRQSIHDLVAGTVVLHGRS
jgi:uncharacterized RDD family membrane protein YckC